ncbi:MAG: NUDIX hydrolase, partial [Bacilli bacterium]|nr:NUDIX hydrolase [Bacilli bacterium]
NKEILLVESFGTIQFPGGHIEENESLNDALIREVKEETGMTLTGQFEPFYAIKYYLKDFPVIGNNRSIEIYYYYIPTDKKFNTQKLYLDDQERTGDFKLYYVPIKDMKKVLDKNIHNNQINKIVNREMKLAIKNLKKRGIKL